jgi:hypothetical protein
VCRACDTACSYPVPSNSISYLAEDKLKEIHPDIHDVLVNCLHLDFCPDDSLYLHAGLAETLIKTHEETNQETLISFVNLAHHGLELSRNSLRIEETSHEVLFLLRPLGCFRSDLLQLAVQHD